MSPPSDFLTDWYADSGFPPHEAFSAVVELLGGDDLADPDIRVRARLASPVALASANAPPMLVVHGTLDDLVPVGQARKLVTALLDLGVEASLLELPENDHSQESLVGPEDGPPSAVRREIVDFFVRTLGPVRQTG